MDMEGSGCSLVEGITLAFSYGDYRNPRKPSLKIVSLPGFEPLTSQVQITTFIARASLLGDWMARVEVDHVLD
jgi:hypothetical protein